MHPSDPGPHRRARALEIRREESRRGPHLLHKRPAKAEVPLPRLVRHAQCHRYLYGGDCIAARSVERAVSFPCIPQDRAGTGELDSGRPRGSLDRKLVKELTTERLATNYTNAHETTDEHRSVLLVLLGAHKVHSSVKFAPGSWHGRPARGKWDLNRSWPRRPNATKIRLV